MALARGVERVSDEEKEVTGRGEGHWRSHWNFHQSDRRKQRSEEEISLQESRIQTHCEEAQVIISSPGESSLEEYLEEVMFLLNQNYVEDENGEFLFVYQPEHIRWLMLPNHEHLDLLIGLREIDSSKLIGFLAACPIALHVGNPPVSVVQAEGDRDENYQTTVSSGSQDAALVDFVCVHKTRRRERLCPLLYDILDLRLQRKGIVAMVKTSGTQLDHPVTAINYYHLTLNYDRCGVATFCSPRGLHQRPTLSSKYTDFFTLLEERHLESVFDLFTREAQKYSIGLLLPTIQHTKHFLMERKDIVVTLVRQDPDSPNHITDLVTIFFVPHKIMIPGNPLEGDILRIGYVSYHIATTITVPELLKVAAVICRDRYELDCLNMLPVGGITPETCRQVRAGVGTGTLYYYINSGVGVDRPLTSSDLFIFPGV